MPRYPTHRPPLDEERLKLCPYGDSKCRICQLPTAAILDLHGKKFSEGYTYPKLRQYIKENYKISEDYTRINNHFNKHVLGKHVIENAIAKREIKYPEVTKALESIPEAVKVTTSGNLEKAYGDLVSMAQTFVKKTRHLQDRINLQIENRSQTTELDDELSGISALELLERQAKINKEAREFIKEIQMLRAPKVLVAQFLENFINNVIKEMGVILSNMAGDLKFRVTNELKENGMSEMVSEQTFINVFKEVALNYRDRMVSLKRQQMSEAVATLQDLEKLV